MPQMDIPDWLLTYLRDPLWQFAGVLVGLVAIWFATRDDRQPGIRFHVDTIRLANVAPGAAKAISILFNGVAVREPYAARIAFRVTGRSPIRPEDFHGPFGFSVGKDVELLSVEVDKVRPSELEIRFARHNDEPDRVDIEALLLNPGDMVSFRCVVDGTPKPKAFARIAGISDIDSRIGVGVGKMALMMLKFGVGVALLLLPFNRQWALMALVTIPVGIFSGVVQWPQESHRDMSRWLRGEKDGDD